MSRIRLRTLFIALSLSALALGSVGSPVAAARATRFVDDDGHAGPADCDGTNNVPMTIQAAVNAAIPGDDIVICPGTYVGDVKIKTSNIRLRAADPWTANLVVPSGQDSQKPLLWIKDAAGVRVKWLHLTQPTGTGCATAVALIKLENAPRTQVRANSLDISGTDGTGPCGYEIGIWVSTGSRRSTVAYNTVTDFKTAGIDVGSRRTRVISNTINYYHATGGGGGFPYGINVELNGDYTRVNSNVIRGLSTAGSTTPILDYGIRIAPGIDYPAVINNSLDYVSTAMGFLSVTYGEVLNNTVHNGQSWGIALSGATNMTVANNEVTGNYLGITVSSESIDNNIHDNNFDGNSNDCWDHSSGTGTAGTANTWTTDYGTYSDPDAICDPAP